MQQHNSRMGFLLFLGLHGPRIDWVSFRLNHRSAEEKIMLLLSPLHPSVRLGMRRLGKRRTILIDAGGTLCIESTNGNSPTTTTRKIDTGIRQECVSTHFHVHRLPGWAKAAQIIDCARESGTLKYPCALSILLAQPCQPKEAPKTGDTCSLKTDSTRNCIRQQRGFLQSALGAMTLLLTVPIAHLDYKPRAQIRADFILPFHL